MPRPPATSSLWPILAVALLVPLAAAGQDLALGTWTGVMSAPGGRPIPVSFEVSRTGGVFSIVMSSAQVEGAVAFSDVRLAGDELTFWWEPDVRVECVLGRTAAGGFEGGCSDGSGSGEGLLRMVPPAG